MMAEALEIVLTQLADEGQPVHTINLIQLSDLTREQVSRFRTVSAGLSSPRRLELIRRMVEQAEANIHLSFHAALRECLTDREAQVRRLAIEGLWEDDRPNLIPRLAALMAEDPAAEVRAAAASSLGRFVLMGVLGEIAETVAFQAEQALLSAWYRPREVTEVRRRALEGYAYTADPIVHDLIYSAYYDEDAEMRLSAVFAMGRTADQRWGKPVLEELYSTDPAMRFEAATSSGELALTAAVKRLVELLDDADSNVREAAALALGKIGGRTARQALEIVLHRDDARLAAAAEEALAELSFNGETLEFEEEPGRSRSGALTDEDELDQVELDDEDDSNWDDEEFEDLGQDDEEIDLDWDEEDEEDEEWDGDDEDEDADRWD